MVLDWADKCSSNVIKISLWSRNLHSLRCVSQLQNTVFLVFGWHCLVWGAITVVDEKMDWTVNAMRVPSCAWVSVPSWATELLSRNLLLAGCNQCKLLVNFGNSWTKQKCLVLSSSIKRNMSRKQGLGVRSHTSACRQFRSRKLRAWSAGKKSWCQ